MDFTYIVLFLNQIIELIWLWLDYVEMRNASKLTVIKLDEKLIKYIKMKSQ